MKLTPTALLAAPNPPLGMVTDLRKDRANAINTHPRYMAVGRLSGRPSGPLIAPMLGMKSLPKVRLGDAPVRACPHGGTTRRPE